MTPQLAVIDLSVSAGGKKLVRSASFAIGRGANLTILGETGSGKSLLSHAIMATLPHSLTSEGQVVVDGVATDPGSTARRRLWGRTLALLPQEPWLSLDPTMRSLQQVAEGYRDVERRGALENAKRTLGALGLANAVRHYPFQLSGGMAQRAAIAAAGAGGASVFIADEPTKGLDAGLRDSVIALLGSLVASGRTLLTITHDVQVARALGGEVAVMLGGEIVEHGDATNILGAPRHAYTRRLLAAEPSAWPARPPQKVGSTILRAINLTKRYGSKTLFENLDIAVGAGQRLAVVGPSGSGKTTLGDILIGLTPANSGQVERAPNLPSLSLQKLYQDPVAAFPQRIKLRNTLDDIIARFRLDPCELERLMTRLRLAPDLLDRRPNQVSGGELQRFAIARLLLISPRLVFADEPTSRLDLITQQETLDLLVEHAAERDCAMLLVTHEPAIAANIAGDALVRLSG